MALLLCALGVPVACSSSNGGTGDYTGSTSMPSSSTIQKEPGADASITDAAASATVDAGDGGDCNDGVKDDMETDVDCGGTVCAPCADGRACIEPTDCAGKGCTKNVCVTPTCTDGVTNQDETDVDCGGAVCPKCIFGKACKSGNDCSSTACNGGSCGCPSGMVIVPQAEALGGSYCIDETEVAAGQYNDFIKANQPLDTNVPGCGGNATYVPRNEWPPSVPLGASDSLPVRYVDWCDAYEYCAWRGKQLCGNIGGGAIALDTDDLNRAHSALDAGTSSADGGTRSPLDAWYNACSAQGVNVYPYGGTFDAAKCDTSIGIDAGTAALTAVVSYDDSGNQHDIIGSTCQGGEQMLFHMSGNVYEWENSCSQMNGASPAGTDSCAVRGGSYLSSNTTDVACAWSSDQVRSRMPDPPSGNDQDPLADVGIRCCVY